MRGRDDFPQPARRRAALQREQGRVIVDIPKNEGERQRPSNEILRSDFMWHSKTGEPTGRRHPPHLQQSAKWHEPHHAEWQKPALVERVKATDSSKPCTFFFLHRFRVQTLRNVVHATESEDRTPRNAQSVTQTHIFLVSRTCDREANAHAFGSRCLSCVVLFAHPKSHPLTTCFIVHSLMNEDEPQRNSARRHLFGGLVDQSPLTRYATMERHVPGP